MEVATELGINTINRLLGNISSRECGAVGGHMVRRMIAAAEQALINQQGGFNLTRCSTTWWKINHSSLAFLS